MNNENPAMLMSWLMIWATNDQLYWGFYLRNMLNVLQQRSLSANSPIFFSVSHELKVGANRGNPNITSKAELLPVSSTRDPKSEESINA